MQSGKRATIRKNGVDRIVEGRRAGNSWRFRRARKSTRAKTETLRFGYPAKSIIILCLILASLM
jgi:hypothetical protein